MTAEKSNGTIPSVAIDRDIIGKASATERVPNTSDTFSFWLAPGELVNPFDIMEADQIRETQTYGLVTNVSHITDAPSHLSNFISNDFGDVSGSPQTPRQGVNVAEARVLANHDSAEDASGPMGIYMPVQNESPIRFADEAGIHAALGIDKILEHQEQTKEKVAIPAGIIRMSNGTSARIFLDSRYVLGPEGAHVNISGISGLATKTSYAMFLIQSILQTVGADDVGVILLNVKQNDLLVVDKPRELAAGDQAAWDAMQLQPTAFQNVTYLLPFGKQTASSGHPNIFGIRPTNSLVYAYAIEDVIGERGSGTPGPGLDLIVDGPDESGTMSSLVGLVQQGILDNRSEWRGVRNWNDLLNNKPLYDPEGQKAVAQKAGDVRADSVGKFLRILRRTVSNRQSGLFVQQRSNNEVNLGEQVRGIRGGRTLVVDIAKLPDLERSLVFGHVIREVYALFSEATPAELRELPRKVIIFVDELNKYAPARGGKGDSSIVSYVLDIASRGRSLGVILISAEQFMSEVHGQVVGNCSTRVIGRSDAAELSDSAYQFVPREVRNNLTRLDKGQLLLSHPIYRQPVRIEFPRPAFQSIGHDVPNS